MASKKKSSKKGKKKGVNGVQKKPLSDAKVTSNSSEMSKSAKKRDKKLKNPDHIHETVAQTKALRYLKLWYADKKGNNDDTGQNWKFEKCRQIWLLQNCYSATKVPKDDFKVLLKYMATIQGRMRAQALDEAKEKVDLVGKWTKLLEDGKLENDIAAQIGKSKPDETTEKRAKKIIKKLNKESEDEAVLS